MSWFYVDDRLHDHPKARKAGTAALGLWALCGAWCADYLTDGWVPAEVARRYGTARQAEKLCAAGLWTAVERDGEKGYQFHEWSAYQKTRAQVETERERTRERVAKHRAKAAGRSGSGTVSGEKRSETEHESQANRLEKNPRSEKEQQVNEPCNGVSTPAPPLPTPVLPKGSTAAARGHGRTRGTTTLAELSASAVTPTARAVVDAWRLDHTDATRYRPQVIRALSKVADGLLRDGAEPTLIRAALDQWDARADVHSPNALTWLYDDAVKRSRATTTGAPATRADKVAGWLDFDESTPAPRSARGDKVAGWLDPDLGQQPPTLTALPGGAA
ncbi:hypothetical protein [Saccharopolyspora sp. 6V]|uniref:hypothetical protein n=1 Tax=Saccharopolyspora sp. 6V TaxID=2877239 RepID=UPI001CD5F008|nr:hypothetical protein [Saccharopolyspora sp. 6V]MCA1195111.1 hypothetical protein [Saccharopolyspora sp. 6V]